MEQRSGMVRLSGGLLLEVITRVESGLLVTGWMI